MEVGTTAGGYEATPSKNETKVSGGLQVSPTTKLCVGVETELPFIPANMDTVIGDKLAQIIFERGGVPIFHRFTDFDTKVGWINDFEGCFISSGIKETEIKEALRQFEAVGPKRAHTLVRQCRVKICRDESKATLHWALSHLMEDYIAVDRAFHTCLMATNAEILPGTAPANELERCNQANIAAVEAQLGIKAKTR